MSFLEFGKVFRTPAELFQVQQYLYDNKILMKDVYIISHVGQCTQHLSDNLFRFDYPVSLVCFPKLSKEVDLDDSDELDL